MNWKKIKENINQYLTNNPDGELKSPERRLRALDNIECRLDKEFINNPIKLLSVDKESLKKDLDIKSAADSSTIDNIYDILNGKTLQSKRKKNSQI